jgi:hypothetical protein
MDTLAAWPKLLVRIPSILSWSVLASDGVPSEDALHKLNWYKGARRQGLGGTRQAIDDQGAQTDSEEGVAVGCNRVE